RAKGAAFVLGPGMSEEDEQRNNRGGREGGEGWNKKNGEAEKKDPEKQRGM
ncbi:Hypothetical predicted protein, partial [Xyrichtys novacula]